MEIYKASNDYDAIEEDPTYRTTRLERHWDFEIEEREGDIYILDDREWNALMAATSEVKIPAHLIDGVIDALVAWKANKTHTEPPPPKAPKKFKEGEIPF